MPSPIAKDIFPCFSNFLSVHDVVGLANLSSQDRNAVLESGYIAKARDIWLHTKQKQAAKVAAVREIIRQLATYNVSLKTKLVERQLSGRFLVEELASTIEISLLDRASLIKRDIEYNAGLNSLIRFIDLDIALDTTKYYNIASRLQVDNERAEELQWWIIDRDIIEAERDNNIDLLQGILLDNTSFPYRHLQNMLIDGIDEERLIHLNKEQKLYMPNQGLRLTDHLDLINTVDLYKYPPTTLELPRIFRT